MMMSTKEVLYLIQIVENQEPSFRDEAGVINTISDLELSFEIRNSKLEQFLVSTDFPNLANAVDSEIMFASILSKYFCINWLVA